MTERFPRSGATFRILWRCGVAIVCVTLVSVAVFWFSRYSQNRRLMALATPANPRNSDILLSWDGQIPQWLERRIGKDRGLALLCRPVSLMVQGGESTLSDDTVLQLLRQSFPLKQILIYNRELPNGCLEVIATRHPVESLTIRLPVINNTDARWLSSMKHLQRVNIDQFVRQPRQNDWSWLKTLPDLQSVSVSMWGATDTDVLALASCPVVTDLDLASEILSDGVVSRLCDLSQLEYLRLSSPQIALHFQGDRKLPSTLKALDLASEVIDDKSLAVIEGLPLLDRVSITEGKISDAGMATLARLPALRQLWLDRLEQVTDDGIKALTSSTSLTEVHLKSCGTTPVCLVHLTAIPNWNELMYNDVQIRRNSGAPAPIVTPEEAEDFLSRQKHIQQMQAPVFNGPLIPTQ